jgi:hypothetical protein
LNLSGLLDHAALQARVVELLSHEVAEVIIVTLDSPGGADRIMAEVFGRRRSVPALDDCVAGLP